MPQHAIPPKDSPPALHSDNVNSRISFIVAKDGPPPVAFLMQTDYSEKRIPDGKPGGFMLYPMFIQRRLLGGLVGELPDFPGCTPEGDTMDELMETVEATVLAWRQEKGITVIPEPSCPEEDDSGCPPLLVEITLPPSCSPEEK